MIRLLDGPGVDDAAAKLRGQGLEVEIVNGPAAVQFWRFCSHRARADAGHSPTPDELTAEHWLLLGPKARELWRGIVAKVEKQPWIDPEVLDLMEFGEEVGLDVDGAGARLRRVDGKWKLSLGDEDLTVGRKFAATWLGEFA